MRVSFTFLGSYGPVFGPTLDLKLVLISTDVDTINAMMWTDRLDDIFAENLKRDPSIYQYFASKEGVLRYFPAHRYHTFNVQDKIGAQ